MKNQKLENALYAIERLHDWADNEQGVTTFQKFCSLIGLSEYRQVWASPVGHLEGDLLADALKAWTRYPKEVKAFIYEECKS